jgi:hypothetical protein
MAALLKLPPVALSLVSAYGLFHSYQSIIRLREYEETTKKAAKYSNTAADQLFKTRTTQGSAAVSVGAPPLSHPTQSHPLIRNAKTPVESNVKQMLTDVYSGFSRSW